MKSLKEGDIDLLMINVQYAKNEHDRIVVQGISKKFEFSKIALSHYDSIIRYLINWLHKDVYSENGISILRMNICSNGVTWTSNFFMIEKLFVIGIAAGMLEEVQSEGLLPFYRFKS